MQISYSPSFINRLEKLESRLQEEVLDKIDLLKDRNNHKMLKVHKLHGKYKNRWSFSVNYEFRILFSYLKKNEIVLLAIGLHDIYKN